MFNASNLGAARRCQSPDRDARQRESEEKIKLFGKIFLLLEAIVSNYSSDCFTSN
jgi:hypothetical protein